MAYLTMAVRSRTSDRCSPQTAEMGWRTREARSSAKGGALPVFKEVQVQFSIWRWREVGDFNLMRVSRVNRNRQISCGQGWRTGRRSERIHMPVQKWRAVKYRVCWKYKRQRLLENSSQIMPRTMHRRTSMESARPSLQMMRQVQRRWAYPQIFSRSQAISQSHLCLRRRYSNRIQATWLK